MTRTLADAPLLVGRADEADLRVDEPSLSRRHLVVHPGAVIELEDLGGANGTRVRGRRLPPNTRVAISPGDLVEMGNAVLVFHSGTSGQLAAAAPSTRAPRFTGTTGEMPMREPGAPAPTPVEKLVAIVASSNVRRDGERQRGHRASHPLAVATQTRSVHPHQLRGAHRVPARE